jgi:hypothetical protein
MIGEEEADEKSEKEEPHCNRRPNPWGTLSPARGREEGCVTSGPKECFAPWNLSERETPGFRGDYPE